MGNIRHSKLMDGWGIWWEFVCIFPRLYFSARGDKMHVHRFVGFWRVLGESLEALFFQYEFAPVTIAIILLTSNYILFQCPSSSIVTPSASTMRTFIILYNSLFDLNPLKTYYFCYSQQADSWTLFLYAEFAKGLRKNIHL